MGKANGLIALAGFVLLAVTPAVDEEPARLYVLKVDGQPVGIQLNEPVKVRINGRETTLALEVEPYRLFNKYGVRFQFPQDFTYDFDDSDPGLMIWGMEKSSSMLMLQKYDLAVTADYMMTLLMASFKAEYRGLKVTESPTEFIGKKARLKGARLVVEMGSVEIIQDVFVFRTKQGLFCLMLQDSKFKLGPNTDEYGLMIDVLKRTLELVE